MEEEREERQKLELMPAGRMGGRAYMNVHRGFGTC